MKWKFLNKSPKICFGRREYNSRRYFFVYYVSIIDPYIKNASEPLKCFLICDEIYESKEIYIESTYETFKAVKG